MRTNCDLTIYSLGVNTSTRSETWTRSTVTGVEWEDRKATARDRDGSGQMQANEVYVYIPMARGALTIKPGDVIVKGIVTDTIGPSFTVTALKAKYASVAVVRSVDKWDQGSLALRHYQIGAS